MTIPTGFRFRLDGTRSAHTLQAFAERRAFRQALPSHSFEWRLAATGRVGPTWTRSSCFTVGQYWHKLTLKSDLEPIDSLAWEFDLRYRRVWSSQKVRTEDDSYMENAWLQLQWAIVRLISEDAKALNKQHILIREENISSIVEKKKQTHEKHLLCSYKCTKIKIRNSHFLWTPEQSWTQRSPLSPKDPDFSAFWSLLHPLLR